MLAGCRSLTPSVLLRQGIGRLRILVSGDQPTDQGGRKVDDIDCGKRDQYPMAALAALAQLHHQDAETGTRR